MRRIVLGLLLAAAFATSASAQYPDCPSCRGIFGHHAYGKGHHIGKGLVSSRYGYGGGHKGGYGGYGGYGHGPMLPGGGMHYRPQTEPAGGPVGTVAYPYYTIRGPRDFLLDNPPSIGPY